jgi:hypothetical protein
MHTFVRGSTSAQANKAEGTARRRCKLQMHSTDTNGSGILTLETLDLQVSLTAAACRSAANRSVPDVWLLSPAIAVSKSTLGNGTAC